MRIKKFTLLTLAIMMMSVVAFAQKPLSASMKGLTPYQQILQAKRQGLVNEQNAQDFKFAKPALPQKMQKAKTVNIPSNAQLKKLPKKDVSRSVLNANVSIRKANGSVASASRRAPEDYPIITEAPEGTVKTYKRAGDCTYVSGSSTVTGTQSGNMEVVFAANNEVYMKNPVCGFGSYVGLNAYARGTLSADGTTITVPLGQNLYYGSSYDAAVATAMADYDSETGLTHDTETTQVTYTIDNEAGTITLNGTSATKRLTAFWTDDDSWSGYSEWNTVLTEKAPLVVPDVVTPPAGLVTEDWTFAGYNSDNEATEFTLQVGLDGTDVYIQGLCVYLPDAWVKGTLSGDGTSISVASGQFFGVYEYEGEDYPMYLVLYDNNTGDIATNVTLPFDAVNGTITVPDDIIIFINGEEDTISYFEYYYYAFAVRGVAPDVQTPSASVAESAAEYRMIAHGYTYDGDEIAEYTIPVFVAYDGNDVWVKGVCEDMPDSWIKGSKTGNTVTFPTGQFFGTASILWFTFDYYFAGFDYASYATADVTMTVDDATGTLTMTSPDEMLINASWLLYNPNMYFDAVQFVPVPDVAATPAQPEITGATLTGTSYPYVSVDIPAEDESGNPILTGKLYYEYYYDVDHTVSELTLTPADYKYLTENMTEIPYNFTDDYDIYNYRLYLNMDFSTWNKIGVKSIYYGGGERHESEIFWYTIKPYPIKSDIVFTSTNDYSIQNGQATVAVNDEDVTADVDANGKLTTIAENSVVTISAAEDYVITDVKASFQGNAVPAIKYSLVDSYGDGWNGNAINVVKASTGDIVATLTITSGATAEGTVDLVGGETYDFVWVPGSYASECSYTITDFNDNVILSGSAGEGMVSGYVTPIGGGAAVAGEVEIGTGDAANSYVPTYSLYNYSLTQQIYTAAEIGQSGTINSISFFNAGQEKVRTLDLYLVHTDKVAFAGSNDWITVSASDKVFSGVVTFTAAGDWTTITLDTPFEYNGTDNLAVIVDDNSGTWSSGLSCRVFNASAQAIRIYSDGTDYDPANPSAYTGTIMDVKNQIKLGMLGAAPVDIDVDVTLAGDGSSASFVMPTKNVKVSYTLEWLGYPVNVPAGQFATYFKDDALTLNIGDDCQLMTITSFSENAVVATPLAVAAANTPLLIYNGGNADVKAYLIPTAETADDITAIPEFKGTLTEKTFTDDDMAVKDYYVCTGKDFVWVRAAGTIAANTCWLELTKDQPQNARSIEFGDNTTGITGVNNVVADGQWYDLNGRKLEQKPTAKGVYIMNGKKHVIK